MNRINLKERLQSHDETELVPGELFVQQSVDGPFWFIAVSDCEGSFEDIVSENFPKIEDAEAQIMSIPAIVIGGKRIHKETVEDVIKKALIEKLKIQDIEVHGSGKDGSVTTDLHISVFHHEH